MSSFFNIPPDISKADKPREFEGRALNSRQAANLSSKKIANCEYASPQSRTGMVHFLAISLTLIQMTLRMESSVGKTAFDFVNFLTILCQLSTAFVVYIIFLISFGYSKNVVSSAQFLSHDFMMLGYFLSHFSRNSSLAYSASSRLTAPQIFFKSVHTAFLSLYGTNLQLFLI